VELFPGDDHPASRFFPGASFEQADGVTGYNDITPRFGAAYDVFGNGKTALQGEHGQVPAGRQRQQPCLRRNPVLRTPAGTGTFGGTFAPSMTRTWQDDELDYVPDCDLRPRERREPRRPPVAPRTASTSAGRQQHELRQHPADRRRTILTSSAVGASVRRTGRWALRAAGALPACVGSKSATPPLVHDVHHRGSVTDNLGDPAEATSPLHADGAVDPRLPGGGGQTVGPLYNTNPTVFGQVNNRIVSDGQDRRRHAHVQRRGRDVQPS
jgi:hypothetical protein